MATDPALDLETTDLSLTSACGGINWRHVLKKTGEYAGPWLPEPYSSRLVNRGANVQGLTWALGAGLGGSLAGPLGTALGASGGYLSGYYGGLLSRDVPIK
jgi:hypothetical protein